MTRVVCVRSLRSRAPRNQALGVAGTAPARSTTVTGTPARRSAAAALRIWTETAKTSRHTPPAGVYGEGSPVPQQGAAGAAAAAAAALRAGLRLGLAPRLRLRFGCRLRRIYL